MKNYWSLNFGLSSVQITLFLARILTLEHICLTSLTRAKCGTRSTLCCKVGNISGSTELFAL